MAMTRRGRRYKGMPIASKGLISICFPFLAVCAFHLAKLVRDRADPVKKKDLDRQIPFQFLIVAGFIIAGVTCAPALGVEFDSRRFVRFRAFCIRGLRLAPCETGRTRSRTWVGRSADPFPVPHRRGLLHRQGRLHDRFGCGIRSAASFPMPTLPGVWGISWECSGCLKRLREYTCFGLG